MQVRLIEVGLVLAALVVCGDAGSSHDTHWSYDELHGPSHWCDMESKCCGKEQSPIDIDEFNTESATFRPLVFFNYSRTPNVMNLLNNGHTISLSLGKNDLTPVVSGGGMKDYYIFDSLHFHWGKDNSVGSEHTVSGKSYPLEMHMVHYNSKYDSKDSAAGNMDGLAVIGVLFLVTEKDNENLKGIVKALDEVRYNNDSARISEPFPLETLMPRFKEDFYRYQGSLTTPPCNEVVTWTVLDSEVGISNSQLNRFRTLRMRTKVDDHRDSDQLVDNYRPTQSLNGRRIHARSTLARMQVRASTSEAVVDRAYMGLMATMLISTSLLKIWA